jgi:putative DNA primase/helicase
MSNLLRTDNAIEEFRQAIITCNFSPPKFLIADGEFQRFSTNGKHSDTAGWYVLDLSGYPNGAFGCWRSGVAHHWKPKFIDSISPAERELYRKRQVQTERKRQQEQIRQWAINAENNKKLLTQAKSPGAEVRSYLAARGLGTWAIPA